MPGEEEKVRSEEVEKRRRGEGEKRGRGEEGKLRSVERVNRRRGESGRWGLFYQPFVSLVYHVLWKIYKGEGSDHQIKLLHNFIKRSVAALKKQSSTPMLRPDGNPQGSPR